MDPNQPPTQFNAPVPNSPVDPLSGYDGTTPQSAGSQTPLAHSGAPKRNRLPFIIAGVVVGLLLIVTFIVVLTSKDKPAPTAKPQVSTSDTTGSSFLRPATAIDVEQTSNSVSQDLSGLNDDSDFPANKLDDKALNL